jgi:hypothetical protein
MYNGHSEQRPALGHRNPRQPNECGSDKLADESSRELLHSALGVLEVFHLCSDRGAHANWSK